jgi:hypothetical protein
MNLEAEDWKLNTLGQIIQSSYEVATLDFPSLYTSDANTAAVKNGVSVPESQVCGLVSRIEMCGYILKKISYCVW